MSVVAIDLTVFGPNKAAQSLYEDLGLEPTVLQMRKRLTPSEADSNGDSNAART